MSISDPRGLPPPSIRQVINITLICRCARIAPKDAAGAAVTLALLRVGVGAGTGRRLPGLTGVLNTAGASGLAGSVTIPRRAGRLGILCKPLRDTRRWWQRVVVEGERLLVIQAAEMGSQGSQPAAHCVRVIVGAVTTVIDGIATGTVGVAFELTQLADQLGMVRDPDQAARPPRQALQVDRGFCDVARIVRDARPSERGQAIEARQHDEVE